MANKKGDISSMGVILTRLPTVFLTLSTKSNKNKQWNILLDNSSEKESDENIIIAGILYVCNWRFKRKEIKYYTNVLKNIQEPDPEYQNLLYKLKPVGSKDEKSKSDDLKDIYGNFVILRNGRLSRTSS